MKILGIDLGTNSIGLLLRNDDFFEWYAVYTFKKGVGNGKVGEFSLAAERTTYRASRRLYNSRRYRKWETLKVLIENGLCPLSIEKLNVWKHYEKGKGRIFPVDDIAFSNWIKLDFNEDGMPDYSSPYQLRKDLFLNKFDLSKEKNRYKLGRALYHIAQRRGFKSSRKHGNNEKTAVYKGSSVTKTIGRDDYEKMIIQNGTVGSAFAQLEDDGVRIRNRYTLRSDFVKEVDLILKKQNTDIDFNIKIKQALFYQRPLRSQKGLIGKCTMEPNKSRCPISHPKFEEYRAWAFVNNIKYKTLNDDTFKDLPLDLKEEIVEQLQIKGRKKEFKTIRNFICKNDRKHWTLNYKRSADSMTVPTCMVSAHLKEAFGEEWKNLKILANKIDKKGNVKSVTYNIGDIWHILFSFEDEEYFNEFLVETLNLNDKQIKPLNQLWKNFPVGYANLSLKAISNILPFLKEGMIYSESVFLAKIPELIGTDLFEDNKEGILSAIQNEIAENQFEKTIVNITNNLIANYKGLSIEERPQYNEDYNEILDDLFKKDVKIVSERYFGKKEWSQNENKEKILNLVEEKYFTFLKEDKKDYLKQPKLSTRVNEFLQNNFSIDEQKLKKIYHPSMMDIYPSLENQQSLASPKTRAFKNPMAYKTLHKLRKVINYLIEIGKIDKDTRIVVEVAKELNDKNKRSAIETYQRKRERENESYANAISQLVSESNFNGLANPNSIIDRQKFRIWTEQIESFEEVKTEIDKIEKEKLSVSEKDIKKYRLWKEQNCVCFYTGRIIKITDLFDKNIIDFEHTIPRSKSFDNSLANLTVCYADYNRNIKKVKIPTELPNYKEDYNEYSAIEPRLDNWKNKVEALKDQIEYWKFKSKTAVEKSQKDDAIREKHLRQMEYDYWHNKLDRFTREDVPEGFKNSQLVDTQIISKYAYHYLRTVFNRVDVIKGAVNAEFRKIYGIQEANTKKDRSKHSHHAKDAAVLTLIPSSAKRKKVLEKAYKYEETTGKKYHEKPFPEFNFKMIQEIDNTILINNLEDQDRTLLPVKKNIRSRGKIVVFKDENGNKTKRVAQGDAVRGELHKQTFYGKIKLAERDENGTLKRDDNGIIQYKQKDGKDEMLMVVRKLIDDIIDGKKVKTDIIVDEHLANHIKKQVDNGAKANEIVDFQGRIIRRVRCKVKSGRGLMNPDKVTVVKEQTYKSAKKYKNYYYADSGENYMFGLYEDEKGKREIKSINLLESTRFSKVLENHDKKEMFKIIEPVFIGKGKNKKEARLKHIFEVGQKVIFFLNDREELKDLDKQDLSDRLYKVYRLADARTQRILFQYHLEARDDKGLQLAFPRETFGTKGKDGFSKLQTDFIAPRLLLTPSSFNFIIENRDFKFNLDGTIEFLY